MQAHGRRRTKVLLLVLLLLLAAGVSLDFRFGYSDLSTSSERLRLEVPDRLSFFPSTELNLYVEGPAVLRNSVRSALAAHLEEEHGIDRLTMLNRKPTGENGPTLVVQVNSNRFFWLPFFSTADLNVDFVYVSEGTIPERGDVIVVRSDEHQTIRGNLDVENRFFGLATFKGSVRYLGEYLASQVSKSLLK